MTDYLRFVTDAVVALHIEECLQWLRYFESYCC